MGRTEPTNQGSRRQIISRTQRNCLRGTDMSCFGSLALELRFVIERRPVKVAGAKLLSVSDLQWNESESSCCYIATLIVLLRG